MEIKILFYNKFWNFEHPDYESANMPYFKFFYDKNFINEADIVVFHVPSLDINAEDLKKLKRTNQTWVYWSYECEVHYPSFQQEEILKLFDLTATYKLDSDVPTPYAVAYKSIDWKKEPKKKTKFINAFFSSNWDASGRYDLLKKLMSKLEIDSFGKILNNRNAIDDPYFTIGIGNESSAFKEGIIGDYKFTLAFENAIAKDYVTEKFFQPLIHGSVPIYLGAPNIEEFAPGDNCYIDANSFSCTSDLINYLDVLNKDIEQYNSFFEWKNLPLRDTFIDKVNMEPDLFKQLFIKVILPRLEEEKRKSF